MRDARRARRRVRRRWLEFTLDDDGNVTDAVVEGGHPDEDPVMRELCRRTQREGVLGRPLDVVLAMVDRHLAELEP